MIVFLLALAAATALLAPRSKPACLFLLFVVGLGIAGNVDNPDRFYYVENFEGIQTGDQDDSFEFGYQTLARLASFLGLNYGTFHFILTGITLALIGKSVLDLTDRPALALLAYLFFPFFWDVTQVRNFYAMAIIIYGMRYLLVDSERSDRKYVITVLLASTFHITSLFYLLFLAARWKSNTALWIGLGVVGTIYTVFFSALVASPLLGFVADKIDVYTSTETSVLTKTAVFGFYAASLALLLWAARHLSPQPVRHRSKLEVASNRYAKQDWPGIRPRYLQISPAMLLNVNLVAGLSILLTLDNLDFIRIYRNLFLINCIFIINGIYRNSRGNRIPMSVCFATYLAVAFAGFVFLTSTSNIIENALFNNIIG